MIWMRYACVRYLSAHKIESTNHVCLITLKMNFLILIWMLEEKYWCSITIRFACVSPFASSAIRIHWALCDLKRKSNIPQPHHIGRSIVGSLISSSATCVFTGSGLLKNSHRNSWLQFELQYGLFFSLHNFLWKYIILP